MTIASCYLSPEGVVFGADSTSTYNTDRGNHYFNHAQKLFEIGEESSLGIVTWGLGGLAVQSYRTLIAELADELSANPPISVADVVTRWIDRYWTAYQNPNGLVGQGIAQCTALHVRPAYDATNVVPNMRSEQEEALYNNLKTALVAGFCIGGYVLPNREPQAYQMLFDPLAQKPTPMAIPMNGQRFWGAPNIIQRLLFGADDELKKGLLASPHWTGTEADLNALVAQHSISHPILPIREAIDFTHACITATIKAIKFSIFSQICGGPVEIAVITTDRKFRWVRHKPWDTAITEGKTI